MAKDAIGFALSALNRLAGSSMLDRLGMRHTAERLAYRLTKGGFQVITTSARAFKSNNPSDKPQRLDAPGHTTGLFDLGITDEQQMIRDSVRAFAAEVLRDTLRKPGYRCRPLVIGTATDPYQPVERERLITREILQVLAECRPPFSLITKSALVLRDLDLIAPMAVEGRASVAVSVTTLDNRLKNQLEPRASGGRERLKTVRELARAGVPVTVLVAPLIPFINDQELEDIVEQVAAAGARSAGYVALRLPHEVGPLWEEWLQRHYPERAERVMSALKEMHGGASYDSRWHHRQRGQGPMAELLARRFQVACQRHGLAPRESFTLDSSAFRPPGLAGQMHLWEA